MTTRVLLLRHAESANPKIFHGMESDVGLSERGERQAEVMGPVLASYRPDQVISSGMRRAIATAQPIARAAGKPLRIEPGFHERRVGALSGTATSLTEGVWPQTLQRWMEGDTGYAPEGAESFDDLQARLLPLWHRVTADAAGQTLVIVAHGVVCKVLLISLQDDKSPRDWLTMGPILNVAIHEFWLGEDNRWEVVRFNDLAEEVRGV